MVVAVGQLDLELDAAEERRGRREREPVEAGREPSASRARPSASVSARAISSPPALSSTATPGAGRPAPVSSTCVESEAVAIGSDS